MSRRMPHDNNKQKALKFTQITAEAYDETGASKVSFDGMMKVYFSGVNKEKILELLRLGYDFNLSSSANDMSMRINICKNDVKMAFLSKKSGMNLQELKHLVSEGMTYEEMLVMYELS